MKTTVKTIMKDMLLVVATAMITLGASAQPTKKGPARKSMVSFEHRFDGQRRPKGMIMHPDFRKAHKAEFPGGGPRPDFRRADGRCKMDKGGACPMKDAHRHDMKKSKECKGDQGARADKK